MCMLKMDRKTTLEPTLGWKTRLFPFIRILSVGQDVWCHSSLLKQPPVAFEKDIFYMRPKAATPSDPESPWYESIPETLRTMLPNMCDKAGIERKTNHSLRDTGATEMFAARS